jgi:hypothetical protein
MSNVSRVNGFRPVKHLNGSPYNGQSNMYYVPATDGTAIYVGDAVKKAATSDSNGVPAVTKASVGDAIIGIVVGIGNTPTANFYANLNTPVYRAASTAGYLLVCDAVDVVYEVQTSNGTLAAADTQKNINHADAGGSATTGLSGETVDVGTKATTATLTFKLQGFSQRVDNDPASASGKVLVSINNHQLASGTGTAGV